VRVGDVHIGPAETDAGADEQQGSDDRRDRQPPVDARPAATPPDDRADQPQQDQEVREGKAERESQQELPGRDHPCGDDPARSTQPVTADAQRQRQGDAAARDHLHVPVLLQPERSEGERGAGDRSAARPEPELAGQEVSADEPERVGEQEHQVVSVDRRVRAGADQAGGGVPDQRVREGERVAERPELVCIEEVKRLVRERMAVPGHLVRLRERVAEILGDVVAQVQDQRPVHDHRHQTGAHDQGAELVRGDLRGPSHPRHPRS
jgi:hypothetical protein